MMKSKIAILILIAASVNGYAQVDRAIAPSPSPAREIKIGEYQSFTLKNGLQVFVVENHKLPRIQFSIELKNNPILEGNKAGYVTLAGDLMGTGTKTRTKAQLDEEVDFIGASLNTSASGIFASSLSKHAEKLLDLMTDVLYNPAFSQDELDKLKSLTISGLAAEKDDPNAIAQNVREALIYGKNHPYGEITTEETVGSVTLQDCRAYYSTYFKANNAYLAIVGDINLKTAKSLVEKHFGKWAKGDVINPTYEMPKPPAKTFVALVDRETSVQSVINVSYPLELYPGNPDVIKAKVTNQIVGGGFSSRLMQNLREDKGFTYGAYTSLSSDRLVGSFNASASVRNDVTDSAVYEIMYELKRITKDTVTDEELAAAKASLSGSFGRSLENPQTVANFALNTARYNLPKDYYNNYVKNIGAVSKDEVKGTAQKYIKPENAYILVVGKGSDVVDNLKPFGEIKYYDIKGDSYMPSKVSAVPAGLTAEKVIANYIQAVGGEEKIKTIKTLKSISKASMQGAEIVVNIIKKAPNKEVLEVLVNGNMQVQKIVVDGKNVSMLQMGQKAPVDADTKEQTLFDAYMMPEMVMKTFGVKTALKGVEKTESGEAYVVEYTFPSGGKSSEYFDTKTGFKVKSVKEVDSPQGKVASVTTFADYKEYSGVKFPSIISQNMGSQVLRIETTSVDLNVPVEDSLFKID